MKTVQAWRNLFKQFLEKLSSINSVKRNEVVTNILAVVQSNFDKTVQLWAFIAYCLADLISALDMNELASKLLKNLIDKKDKGNAPVI